MNYPSISRTNMRQRGPMESTKLNKHYAQSQHSMQTLFDTLESLDYGTKSFLLDARDGGQSQLTGINNMAAELMRIRKEAAFMEGGAQHG